MIWNYNNVHNNPNISLFHFTQQSKPFTNMRAGYLNTYKIYLFKSIYLCLFIFAQIRYPKYARYMEPLAVTE